MADSTFGHTALLQQADTLYCYLGAGGQSLTFEDVRLLGGHARKKLAAAGDAAVAIDFQDLEKKAPDLTKHQVIRCFMEGWHMATYQFTAYKKDAASLNSLKVISESGSFNDADKEARCTAEAVHFTRDLCNEPASKLTPDVYANRLRDAFSETDVTVEIIENEALSEAKFPGIHTVAKGSSQPPKLAVLRLKRSDAKEKIALVGKGVTFDSGGTNVKKGRDISDMKMDMAGSAAVAGTMTLLASSNANVNVTAILPLVENLADANAMLPSDVIQYRNGLTVEVGNTDAEGRLILADGILYAEEIGAKKIIDIATLTGSVMSALGKKAAGIFSNNEDALWHYKQLGDEAGDFVWPMPIYDEYLDLLKTDSADINNMSHSPLDGSIAAALFLKQFVKRAEKWVHIDMAGTMQPRKVHSYYSPGASGYGVRLLYAMVLFESDLKEIQ